MNKQQLEQLSDFEINLAVTISVTGCAPLNKVTGYHSGYAAVDYENENMPNGEGLKYVYIPDYCNNWSDMGSLIDNANISIVKDNGFNWATNHPQELYVPVGDKKHEVQITDNVKTLRAAAIVYLLMQEGV